jgi:hypothetical protein
VDFFICYFSMGFSINLRYTFQFSCLFDYSTLVRCAIGADPGTSSTANDDCGDNDSGLIVGPNESRDSIVPGEH